MTEAGLDRLLDQCVAFHGHLCLGQVLGVRLAMKGLELAAPATPRDLLVVVENDRCIADAIQIVTNTRLGRRTLRLKDYGRMAATFFNTVSSRAFRVRTVFEGKVDPEDQTAARAVLYLGDERVVEWREVTVHLRPEELPGKPRRVVTCAVCGERVFDGKDTITAAGPVCQACSRGSYYAL